VKRLTESRFRIDDIKRIYSNEIPRKQYIHCGGFYGYYVQIRKIDDNTWDVIEKPDWDIIYNEIGKILQLTKNNRGKRCYAILKALINENNFHPSVYTYERKKCYLINDAHKVLNYDESVRPWYNNINDIVCTHLAFDTSSNKYRIIELPAELYPLAKKLLKTMKVG